MKELTFVTLWSVFQEMFGIWLYPIIVTIILVTLLFLLLLLKERSISSRRFTWSQVFGIPGGVIALIMMATFSASGYTDAAGPLDWIVVAGVFVLGFIGAAILFYTLVGWFSKSSTQ